MNVSASTDLGQEVASRPAMLRHVRRDPAVGTPRSHRRPDRPGTIVAPSTVIKRRNMVERATERWQPPPFIPVRTPRDRVLAGARRALDLQAASIWRDLSRELPSVRGTWSTSAAERSRTVACLRRGFGTSASTRPMRRPTSATSSRTSSTSKEILWPVEDDTADVVLATETLEHVPRAPPLRRRGSQVPAHRRPPRPDRALRGALALRPVRLLAVHAVVPQHAAGRRRLQRDQGVRARERVDGGRTEGDRARLAAVGAAAGA